MVVALFENFTLGKHLTILKTSHGNHQLQTRSCIVIRFLYTLQDPQCCNHHSRWFSHVPRKWMAYKKCFQCNCQVKRHHYSHYYMPFKWSKHAYVFWKSLRLENQYLKRMCMGTQVHCIFISLTEKRLTKKK